MPDIEIAACPTNKAKNATPIRSQFGDVSEPGELGIGHLASTGLMLTQ